MNNRTSRIRNTDLFDTDLEYIIPLLEQTEYPWEILPLIKMHIEMLLERGIDGFHEIMPGVLVGENVTIAPTAVIEAPAVIGAGTVLRPDAYIRGNVITGRDCVIGHASEVKNSVLLDRVAIPHYNYAGDSILGTRAHLGAGSVCSNLKGDSSEVIIHGERDFPTGLRKIGAFLGDGADIGCGCVLNPGTVVGRGTTVYPMTALRGVYPAGCIVKSNDNIVVRVDGSGQETGVRVCAE